MFDSLGLPSWQQTLAPGDIVLFRYPSAEDEPRFEKARPCLVAEVDRAAETPMARVVYGTATDSRANRGFEIRVRHTEDYAAAGLNKPTRFVAARSIEVPLSDDRFCTTNAGGPQLGTLPPALLARLDTVRALLRLLPEDQRPTTGRVSRRTRQALREKTGWKHQCNHQPR